MGGCEMEGGEKEWKFFNNKIPKRKKRCNNFIKNLFDLRNPLGIYKFWSNSEKKKL
jgi:hypothetical protein